MWRSVKYALGKFHSVLNTFGDELVRYPDALRTCLLFMHISKADPDVFHYNTP